MFRLQWDLAKKRLNSNSPKNSEGIYNRLELLCVEIISHNFRFHLDDGDCDNDDDYDHDDDLTPTMEK